MGALKQDPRKPHSSRVEVNHGPHFNRVNTILFEKADHFLKEGRTTALEEAIV
jgi:hypothetical protein